MRLIFVALGVASIAVLGGVVTSVYSMDHAEPVDEPPPLTTGTERRGAQPLREASPAPAKPVPAGCVDKSENCARWATMGECDANPAYMLSDCARSCDACDAASKAAVSKSRAVCHRTAETAPALRAGDIHAVFERVLENYGERVTVLSRPPEGPWVVTIDDFLDASEVEALVTKGGHHFERSLAGDAVTQVRTSETSWCNVPYCENDETVKRIKLRVSNATGVPLTNSEHIQVLRYGPGDFYRSHHDQNARPRSPWGPRLFTFFLYLSDVEEGGATRFSKLGLTVQPKRGRALVWPSVHNDDPGCTRRGGMYGNADERTTHEAMPVTAGVKFAANMWLHQYDFQRPLAAGCRNEDDAQCGACNPEDRPADVVMRAS